MMRFLRTKECLLRLQLRLRLMLGLLHLLLCVLRLMMGIPRVKECLLRLTCAWC